MKPPIDEIICGDNIEVMSGWEDECIDLTITSPPYDKTDYDKKGNLITHSDQGLRDYNGYSWDFVKVAQQLYRITKKGGVVVWVVGDATVKGSETGSSFRQALYFMGLGFRLHQTIIYEKDGLPFPPKGRYYSSFEYCFVLSKGMPKSINIQAVKTSQSGKSSKPTFRQVNGDLSGNGKVTIGKARPMKNVWRFGTGNGKSTPDNYAFEHPAIFPESLAERHILSWSNPGDIVLDPFAGSGTTPKMCAKTDRHFIGIDTSPDYVELAERRIAAVRQQPKLFSWDLQPAVK